MSDEMKAYIGERLDIMDVVELRVGNGVDYYLRIDGGYSDSSEMVDGMLEYHREEWRKAVKSMGLTVGKRWFGDS